MVGVSCCTATLASCCLGDDELRMEMDDLTLAEYQAHPDSTYPKEFGGQVPYKNAPPKPPAAPAFNPNVNLSSASTSVSNSTRSSGYSNISRSCYDMLER